MKTAGKQAATAADMAYAALFAVLMCVCAWITVPGPVPFTLQTFGVFCALGTLGGRRGTWAVGTYLLLGAAGLPVFSGAQGGVGVLFGATGGFIGGFLAAALVYRLAERGFGAGPAAAAFGMAGGLLCCYALGTAWFMAVYARAGTSVTLSRALSLCVLPFLLPDAAKLALAAALSRRLRRMVKRRPTGNGSAGRV